MKKDEVPYIKFYPGDWLKCPEVQSLRLDHQALWFNMICYMSESTERGVMVKPSGEPYSREEIVRLCGLDNQNSEIWISTLEKNKVFSVREDGAIFCRRMVRDEENRKKWLKNAKKGGNPALMENLDNQNMENLDNQKSNQNPDNDNDNEFKNESEDKIKGGGGGKHLFKNSPFFDFEKFKAELPEWDMLKCRQYWESARDYSDANGAKYLNWISAVRNWERKDRQKQANSNRYGRQELTKEDIYNSYKDWQPPKKGSGGILG